MRGLGIARHASSRGREVHVCGRWGDIIDNARMAILALQLGVRRRRVEPIRLESSDVGRRPLSCRRPRVDRRLLANIHRWNNALASSWGGNRSSACGMKSASSGRRGGRGQ